MCGLTALSGVELFSLMPHYKMDTRLSGKKLGQVLQNAGTTPEV
jgi:hypothetical protein